MNDAEHNPSEQVPDTEGLAEKSKLLLQDCDYSTLATQSLKHSGFPFASVVPYALDELGRPLFLISSMATHTKNLKTDDHACLLVESSDSEERLAGARVSVIGNIAPIPKENEAEVASASQVYLKKHPTARQWADFGDFTWCRLEIEEIYVVAGFGSMGWVKRDDYLSLFPD